MLSKTVSYRNVPNDTIANPKSVPTVLLKTSSNSHRPLRRTSCSNSSITDVTIPAIKICFIFHFGSVIFVRNPMGMNRMMFNKSSHKTIRLPCKINRYDQNGCRRWVYDKPVILFSTSDDNTIYK